MYPTWTGTTAIEVRVDILEAETKEYYGVAYFLMVARSETPPKGLTKPKYLSDFFLPSLQMQEKMDF